MGRIGESDFRDIVFHDAATAANQGASFYVGGFKTVSVEIYGTSSTRTVTFKEIGPSGAPYAITGVRLSDLSTGQSTTGSGERWQFDVTGMNVIIMELTSVAGGNVSVKGKAVA